MFGAVFFDNGRGWSYLRGSRTTRRSSLHWFCEFSRRLLVSWVTDSAGVVALSVGSVLWRAVLLGN